MTLQDDVRDAPILRARVDELEAYIRKTRWEGGAVRAIARMTELEEAIHAFMLRVTNGPPASPSVGEEPYINPFVEALKNPKLRAQIAQLENPHSSEARIKVGDTVTMTSDVLVEYRHRVGVVRELRGIEARVEIAGHNVDPWLYLEHLIKIPCANDTESIRRATLAAHNPDAALDELAKLIEASGAVMYLHNSGCAMWRKPPEPCDKECGKRAYAARDAQRPNEAPRGTCVRCSEKVGQTFGGLCIDCDALVDAIEVYVQHEPDCTCGLDPKCVKAPRSDKAPLDIIRGRAIIEAALHWRERVSQGLTTAAALEKLETAIDETPKATPIEATHLPPRNVEGRCDARMYERGRWYECAHKPTECAASSEHYWLRTTEDEPRAETPEKKSRP